MDRFGSANNLITISPSLPNRRGKRPVTIRGPLHVQCGDYGDDIALHHLVDEVIAWPNIEAGPLPVGSANLISLKVSEEVETADPSVFITGREFGRVLFGAPTIYLTLPLSCAHWAIIRGWAEPHFSSSFGLVPPGVMVVYTPRDEHEVTVCRSLFWVSYNFSLSERRKNSAEWVPLFGVGDNSDIQEPVESQWHSRNRIGVPKGNCWRLPFILMQMHGIEIPSRSRRPLVAKIAGDQFAYFKLE